MFDRSELLICLLLSAEARKPWARWPQFVRRHFVHYLWVLLSRCQAGTRQWHST